MRLLLADDHTPFRRELRRSLEAHGFTVSGEAPDGSSAVRMARELQPDVIVIDVGIDAAEVAQEILDDDPAARVVVLTPSEDGQREVLDALLAGACGYLLRDADPAEMAVGLRAAAAGDAVISPEVATRLVSHLRAQRRAERVQAPPTPPPLTARERDILRLLAQGRENSAIANELVISPATVKTHVAHLLDKLGLDNRVQAAVFAVRHGIV